MKMTVLVPTYRRPKDLARCLAALQHQDRAPDEVLVTVRHTDEDTWKFLATFDRQNLPLKALSIDVPGVVAAMNLGFDSAQGDIISVTDDDAAPHPDWLTQIEAHFLADDRLGGLGGRDYIPTNMPQQNLSPTSGFSPTVGQLQWFGRMIGNHHIGTGAAREIDILKGVNMSFRRTALGNLRCEERLKGTGAQVHFELGLSLALKQQGWKLIYDPAVAVDHYVSQRFDEDQRHSFNPLACSNIAHNETLILLSHLPPLRRIVYILWALFVGVRGTPGFVQLLRFLPSERGLVVQRWVAAMQGRWQGWQTWQASRRTGLTQPTNQPVRADL